MLYQADNNTIYQSFSELSSPPHEYYQEQPQCQQCQQMQEYIYRLEQEVSELNIKLQQQQQYQQQQPIQNKKQKHLIYKKLPNICVKPQQDIVLHHKMTHSLHEGILQQTTHQKKRIFEDNNQKTSNQALQFYKL